MALTPKIVSLLTVVFFVFQTFTTLADAATTIPNTAIIINQVRGSESCCQPGSLENLNAQLQKATEKKLPTTFSIRYDALTEPTFVSLLTTAQQNDPTLIFLGGFLEITPSLAKAAGVEYHGTNDTWNQAQVAYTVGYTPADRKKLIDTYMATFKQKFGFFPTLTTAWISDTSTLNYLYDTYGVSVHQLTREQWDVDSYTLWGGPVHYPYLASKSWAFLPKQASANSSICIVRQTITDPVWNYGDTTSSFTSQPNDYARGNRTRSYGEALIKQALLEQPNQQPGFAVLGLENSMDQPYQQDFFAQQALLSNLQDSNQLIVATPIQVAQNCHQYKTTVYAGTSQLADPTQKLSDNEYQAVWITTENYRARIIANAHTLKLTDFRVYDSAFTDPYDLPQQNQPLSGTWVAPFLLDSARFSDVQQTNQPILKQFFAPPTLESTTYTTPHSDIPIHEDLDDAATYKNLLPGVVLAHTMDPSSLSLSVDPTQNQVLVSFGDSQLTFSAKTITRTATSRAQVLSNKKTLNLPTIYKGNYFLPSLFWNTSELTESLISLNASCTDDHHCQWQVASNPTLWPQALRTFAGLLLPIKQLDTPSTQETKAYISNKSAVAGANPIRLVIAAYNQHGIPIIPTTNSLQISSSNPHTTISTITSQPHTPFLFVDIQSPQRSTETISVTLNQKSILTEKILFVTNCPRQAITCILHPSHLLEWGIDKVTSFIRLKID